MSFDGDRRKQWCWTCFREQRAAGEIDRLVPLAGDLARLRKELAGLTPVQMTNLIAALVQRVAGIPPRGRVL